MARKRKAKTSRVNAARVNDHSPESRGDDNLNNAETESRSQTTAESAESSDDIVELNVGPTTSSNTSTVISEEEVEAAKEPAESAPSTTKAGGISDQTSENSTFTSLESPVAIRRVDDDVEIAFPSAPTHIDLTNTAFTPSRSRASSKLASPNMIFTSRSRTDTVGSTDSKASGRIDDQSYFSGPDDKLVSRLANKFEAEANDSHDEVRSRPRAKSMGRKKIDTSFLNEDQTISAKKSPGPTHTLLRKSSSEFFRKKVAEQPGAPPPMPDVPTNLGSPWASDKVRSPVSPGSSVRSLSPVILMHERPNSDLRTIRNVDSIAKDDKNLLDTPVDNEGTPTKARASSLSVKDRESSRSSVRSADVPDPAHEVIHEREGNNFDQQERKSLLKPLQAGPGENGAISDSHEHKSLLKPLKKESAEANNSDLQESKSVSRSLNAGSGEQEDSFEPQKAQSLLKPLRTGSTGSYSTQTSTRSSLKPLSDRAIENQEEQEVVKEAIAEPESRSEKLGTTNELAKQQTIIPVDGTANLSRLDTKNVKNSLPSTSDSTSTTVKYSSTSTPSPTTAVSSASDDDDNLIFGVCVVGFHHARGPEVEYWVGPGEDRSNLWPYLAFQCLPDGSHSHEENFCYFTLLYDEKQGIAPNPTPHRDEEGHIIEQSDFSSVVTLFGISCNRQIKTEDLKIKHDDVTRSIVQKSVVVIAKKPIFGPIKDKLAIVTRAFFSQGDFDDRSLVDNFYENLRLTFNQDVGDTDLTVGMPLRELVHRLGHQVLVILKALLLETRILFFASNTELLCASQFSLASLIPNLVNHLEDCGSPLLSTYETTLQKPTSLKTSNRDSLLSYMGLPLQIFAAGGMFSPYVPLQQIDELKAPETKYFLIGTTNSLFMEPKAVATDLVVDMDADTVVIHDDSEQTAHFGHKMSQMLSLSSMDKKWIDHITKAVEDTWDPEDPWRPKDNGFYGTEDYIRMQFEDYLLHLLASAKYDEFLSKGGRLPPVHKRDNPIKHFNSQWVSAWRGTNNYRIFSKFTDAELFDIVEPKHIASFPPGSSTILGLPPSEDNHLKQNVANGVSRIFGGFWGPKSANNSTQDVTDPNPTQPKNRLSVSSVKSTLSRSSIIKSAASSAISLVNNENDNVEGYHPSAHNSTHSVSTISSSNSNSNSNNGTKSESESRNSVSGYFSGWGSWASLKRKQFADSRSQSAEKKDLPAAEVDPKNPAETES